MLLVPNYLSNGADVRKEAKSSKGSGAPPSTLENVMDEDETMEKVKIKKSHIRQVPI
jgi:hypothetical protein